MISLSLERKLPVYCFRYLSWATRTLRCSGEKLLVELSIHSAYQPALNPLLQHVFVRWGRCLAGGVEKQSRDALHLVQAFRQHSTSWEVPGASNPMHFRGSMGQSVSFLPPLCNPHLVSKSLITCHLFPVSTILFMSLSSFLLHFLLFLSLRILLPLRKSFCCNEVSRGNGNKRKEFNPP